MSQNIKHTSVYDSFIESISVVSDRYYVEERLNVKGDYDLFVYNRSFSEGCPVGSLLSSVILDAAYEFCISEKGVKYEYMVVPYEVLPATYIPCLILYHE